MENITPYGSFVNEGMSPKDGLKLLLGECNNIASQLMRGNEQSKTLGKMAAYIADSFENNPDELRRIYAEIEGMREELSKISHRSYGVAKDDILPGFDPEGFRGYLQYFGILLDMPKEVAGAMGGINHNWVYSLGLVLYYIYVSIFDPPLFSRVVDVFGFKK